MLSVQVTPDGVVIEGDSGQLMRICQTILGAAGDCAVFGAPAELSSVIDGVLPITVRCTGLTRVD